MPKKIFIPLLLLAFLLAACGGELQTPEVEASAQEENPVSEAETSEVSEASEESETNAAAEATASEQPAPTNVGTGEFVSECAISDSLAEGPTQFEELFAVRESDWVVGPEDAAITLIEYGDFQ
jgi:hypothetical protein